MSDVDMDLQAICLDAERITNTPEETTETADPEDVLTTGLLDAATKKLTLESPVTSSAIASIEMS